MDATQAQQFLRQQLSYAGIVLDEAERVERLPAKRAFLQSAVMALGLGLERYTAQVLGLATFRFSGATASPLSMLPEKVGSSVKQDELISLLDEGGWLAEFSLLYTTLQTLPPPPSSSVMSSSASIVDPDTASQLIASSSQQASTLHWTQTEVGVLRTYMERAEELVDRHSSTDQEW